MLGTELGASGLTAQLKCSLGDRVGIEQQRGSACGTNGERPTQP